MTGKRIGYIRVSTIDQNPERQLENVQLDKKFIDYASASTTNRPELKLMLEFVREDDIVIVHSMDRLARSVRDLRKIVDDLVARKIQIHFVKEGLIFDGKENAMSNLLLSVMGALAEFELSFIRERQREGIEAAKKKGKFKGSKPKLGSERIEVLRQQLLKNKSKLQLARELGISAATLYRYINNMKKEQDALSL